MTSSTRLVTTSTDGPEDPIQRIATDVAETADAVTRNWWVPLITGIAWTILSVIIFRFDVTSVAAVSVLFGAVALAASANEFVRAYLTAGGWRVVHVLLGILFVAVGITAFVHPWTTFVGLAALVGFFLIFNGTFDLIQAFWNGREAQGSWLLAITGVAELGLGLWAAGSWNLSVVVLIAWVGASALIRGITEITAAFYLRELHTAKP